MPHLFFIVVVGLIVLSFLAWVYRRKSKKRPHSVMIVQKQTEGLQIQFDFIRRLQHLESFYQQLSTRLARLEQEIHSFQRSFHNTQAEAPTSPEVKQPPPQLVYPGVAGDTQPVAVIDGANMAYLDRVDGRCRIKPLEMVVDEARRLGYNPMVIVDASLKHTIDEPQRLIEHEKRGVIHEVPARTDADYFILATAQEYKAVVVSNDGFEEYRGQFPWIEERVRFRRVMLSPRGERVFFYTDTGQKGAEDKT